MLLVVWLPRAVEVSVRAVIFVAVFLHNGLGYLLGYGAGKLVGMNTAKKRTIAIEVGMQNAGLATNLATTTAQFSATPESAIIFCTWHSYPDIPCKFPAGQRKWKRCAFGDKSSCDLIALDGQF